MSIKKKKKEINENFIFSHLTESLLKIINCTLNKRALNIQN